MSIDTLYTDPRLVVLYDTLNPFAADTAFYLALASTLRARRVVDIGCGTGLLTCELALRDHDVTGIDPSRAMLDVARGRHAGERVQWIEGDAAHVDVEHADLVVMTGHVAQVFIDDESWHRVLAAAHRMLRPGGHLAFESRHPQRAPWRDWTPERSHRTIVDASEQVVEIWQTLIEVRDDCVRFATHYRFAATGDELVSTSELRFRTQTALNASLDQAGFDVAQWYGDWSQTPVDDASRELIIVAARR
jgi:SAM-dependent methyltransferase